MPLVFIGSFNCAGMYRLCPLHTRRAAGGLGSGAARAGGAGLGGWPTGSSYVCRWPWLVQCRLNCTERAVMGLPRGRWAAELLPVRRAWLSIHPGACSQSWLPLFQPACLAAPLFQPACLCANCRTGSVAGQLSETKSLSVASSGATGPGGAPSGVAAAPASGVQPATALLAPLKEMLESCTLQQEVLREMVSRAGPGWKAANADGRGWARLLEVPPAGGACKNPQAERAVGAVGPAVCALCCYVASPLGRATPPCSPSRLTVAGPCTPCPRSPRSEQASLPPKRNNQPRPPAHPPRRWRPWRTRSAASRAC